MMLVWPKHFISKHFKEVSSTSDVLRQMLHDNNTNCNMLVSADVQTKGRGTKDRIWESFSGNAQFSLLINSINNDLNCMPFVCAVSVGQTLIPFLSNDFDLSYKWPNDVLVKGKKICGIRIENFISYKEKNATWLIIGIGVNLIDSPKNLEYLATSIFEETGNMVSVDDFINDFMLNFTTNYNLVLKHGFLQIRSEWMKHAYKLNQQVMLKQDDGGKVSGKFVGLDHDGSMQLLTNEGKNINIYSASFRM
jgi:BirA family biotin operon repressor/biotin-[acetyl-CoA-carboxylase] ligase